MGLWTVIVIAVVLVAVVAMLVLRRRRPATMAHATPSPSRPPAPPAAPMTDLESALAKVTDRDGHPIRERIDAESVHVDRLRDPDDTGPLLRRALDSVVPHDPPADDPPTDDPPTDHPPTDDAEPGERHA